MRPGAASGSGERQRSACAPGAAQNEYNECTSSAVGWTTSRYFARNRVSIINQAISCLKVRGSCSEEAVLRPRRVTGGGGGSGAPRLSFACEGSPLAARAGGAGGSAWAHWRSKKTTSKKSAWTGRGEECFPPQAPFHIFPNKNKIKNHPPADLRLCVLKTVKHDRCLFTISRIFLKKNPSNVYIK